METVASETEVNGTTQTQPTKKRPLDDGTTLSIEAASEALYRDKFMLAPMVRVVSFCMCTTRLYFRRSFRALTVIQRKQMIRQEETNTKTGQTSQMKTRQE